MKTFLNIIFIFFRYSIAITRTAATVFRTQCATALEPKRTLLALTASATTPTSARWWSSTLRIKQPTASIPARGWKAASQRTSARNIFSRRKRPTATTPMPSATRGWSGRRRAISRPTSSAFVQGGLTSRWPTTPTIVSRPARRSTAPAMATAPKTSTMRR